MDKKQTFVNLKVKARSARNTNLEIGGFFIQLSVDFVLRHVHRSTLWFVKVKLFDIPVIHPFFFLDRKEMTFRNICEKSLWRQKLTVTN